MEDSIPHLQLLLPAIDGALSFKSWIAAAALPMYCIRACRNLSWKEKISRELEDAFKKKLIFEK